MTLEISASAVRANLRLLRERSGPRAQLWIPVKADCYGHGLELLLETICSLADGLCVAAPEEAIAVRRFGGDLPLLVFFSEAAWTRGGERREAIEAMIARNVIQTVVDRDEARLLAETARRFGRRAEVHVKVDSGMGRSGIAAEDAPALVAWVRGMPDLRLTGIYTHFATSDEEDRGFMHRQMALFQQVLEACDGREGLTVHAANSAATLDMPETHFDMVRPGLATYGYLPSPYLNRPAPLRPAMRLISRLMPIKEVPAGSRCGYGLTHTFDRPSRLSRIPIGYGDGYFRSLSNRATVQIRGVDVPVRGRVSMDQIIVDVTDVPGVQRGDEVEVISADREAPHSVENLARLAGTIPHEVCCRLGGRIRRVLVD